MSVRSGSTARTARGAPARAPGGTRGPGRAIPASFRPRHLPRTESPRQRRELAADPRMSRVGSRGPRDHDEIDLARESRSSAPYALANPALDAVAHHRAADLSAHGDPDAATAGERE